MGGAKEKKPVTEKVLVGTRLISLSLSLGAYVCRGRSAGVVPLGVALREDPALQLVIPLRSRGRGSQLPPPPGPALSRLLAAMLAHDPLARPPAAHT